MLYVLTMTYQPGGLSEALSASHRAWVEKRYAEGDFLASGPTTDGRGGVALAVSDGREAIDRLLSTDPVVEAGAGAYGVVEVRVTLATEALHWLTA